jgi:hypothetical protein
MNFEVQRRQCKTCIFRAKHWPPGFLEAKLDDIRDPAMAGFFLGYRICHHSKAACCAGFWARHKDDFTFGQIAQRLGLVEYVDDDQLDG